MRKNDQKVIACQFNQQKEKNISPLISDFSIQKVENVHTFQRGHPNYTMTPLVRLSNLAKHLGLKNVFVKDEAHRFGLNAFKVLGGMYAVGRYLAEQLDQDIEMLSFETLTSPETKRRIGETTFTTATDGNHGRAIAWAAKELGHKAVIYLPKGASVNRVEAIRNEGAEVIVTDSNYDDTVRYAAKEAEENDWVIVQDTSWEGYEKIPGWMMQGYAGIAKEIAEQMEEQVDARPTHIFLQAGVGSYAAAVAAYIVQHYGENHPKVILVEPHQANCYYQSVVSGGEDFQRISGDLNTIMAGLSCGEPNPRAWKILKRTTEAAFSCDDRVSALGMRMLGHPFGEDKRIISGESGAVTTGLLYCLMKDLRYNQIREKLGLDAESQVVLISTEGDTDTDHYQEIVWEGAYPLR